MFEIWSREREAMARGGYAPRKPVADAFEERVDTPGKWARRVRRASLVMGLLGAPARDGKKQEAAAPGVSEPLLVVHGASVVLDQVLSVLGSWVKARRCFHLFLFLTAPRMVSPQYPGTNSRTFLPQGGLPLLSGELDPELALQMRAELVAIRDHKKSGTGSPLLSPTSTRHSLTPTSSLVSTTSATSWSSSRWEDGAFVRPRRLQGTSSATDRRGFLLEDADERQRALHTESAEYDAQHAKKERAQRSAWLAWLEAQGGSTKDFAAAARARPAPQPCRSARLLHS